MLKRTFAIALSAAFLATMTTAIVIVPVERAAAEMAAKEKKSKEKPGISFSDRRKRCGVEWKEAKAAGKTSNWKWPKFWSDCNKRLKAQSA